MVFLTITMSPRLVFCWNHAALASVTLMQPCDTFWLPCAHTDHGAPWT